MPKNAGITGFVVALRMISAETDGRRRVKHKGAILEGMGDHPKMAESMIRSSLVMELAAKGSEEVQLAMSSRWSKIRVNQIRIPGSKVPVAVSVEFFFIQEQTDHDDPTDEVHEILRNYIERNHYDSFIAQLVVNSEVKRFK